jgi:hypothetical protein
MRAAIHPEIMTKFSELASTFKGQGLPPSLFVDFLLDRASIVLATCLEDPDDLATAREAFLNAATVHIDANMSKVSLMHATPMGTA